MFADRQSKKQKASIIKDDGSAKGRLGKT